MLANIRRIIGIVGCAVWAVGLGGCSNPCEDLIGHFEAMVRIASVSPQDCGTMSNALQGYLAENSGAISSAIDALVLMEPEEAQTLHTKTTILRGLTARCDGPEMDVFWAALGNATLQKREN